MADKIKGITVQIGGDTAPLSKALRNVDKEVRSTQANLKEVNKLLKLDPKNTNLLKEKQKLLADQIGKTKEKLTALKKAQEEAAKMLANGEIGQKEYDELGRQIEQCEKSLQNLEKEAAETSKKTKLNAEKIGTAFKNAGGKIEEAGKKLAPFSAAAAAGLGVAVKQTADFDAEMSKVAAISGAVGGLRRPKNESSRDGRDHQIQCLRKRRSHGIHGDGWLEDRRHAGRHRRLNEFSGGVWF